MFTDTKIQCAECRAMGWPDMMFICDNPSCTGYFDDPDPDNN